MYMIIGVFDYEDEIKEYPIAYFHEKEKAEQYIKDSKLKKLRDYQYPFRVKSLLASCTDAYVDYKINIDLPINPIIK